MSEENTSKVNGTAPLQRLASLKPPRELTLGGIKPNKKVFTPNLNVARNKNKGPMTNNRDAKKEEKHRHDRDRRNDRNRNIKNGPNVIKSGGVFSEGLGSAERHYSRTSYGRDTDSAQTLQRPTIRVKDVVKIDKELEEQKIRSVFGDSSHLDQDSVDFKNVLEKDAPIKLPMDDGGSTKVQTKPKMLIKEEVIIKEEPNEEPDCSIISEKKPPVLDVKKETFEDTDVVNLLKSDKPTLILLQLPDTLPGRGGSVEDDLPKRKTNAEDQPSTSTPEDVPEKPVDNRCRLSDLEEGRIGKLRVHRSGKVTLSLGDTLFEVCMGTKAAFYQEAVSIGVDDASRSGRMVALGPLTHKLNLLPHWETMFRDMAT